MKVAYFGYDNFATCLTALLDSGHSIEVIFTGDDSLFCNRVIAFAKKYQITLNFNKPDYNQLKPYIDNGVECFFSAEYPWKIPLPKELQYAINVHPTLLPFGRGKTPISYLLLNKAGHSGVTFHKMTAEMDQGDILIQQSINVDETETYDSYIEKLQILTPQLLSKLFSCLDQHYSNTKPQGGGSYWPSLEKNDQTINWCDSIETITHQYRAFGSLGVYATINNKNVVITELNSTVTNHDMAPGTLVHSDNSGIIIAASNGFISAKHGDVFVLDDS